MNSVYVESEFAPLRKVVLTQSEAVFPVFTPKNRRIYLEAYGKDTAGKTDEEVTEMMLHSEEFSEIPQDMESFTRAWNEERDQLKKVLEKYGVEVLRPRLLNETEKELGAVDNGVTAGCGVMNFFARDPFFTIGDHIIEGQFRSPWRRLEVLPIRNILAKEAYENNAYYVAVPMIDLSEGQVSDLGPFLEGGDVLVYGKTVFVGHSGKASNSNGIQWLKNYLSHFGYKVTEVRLDPDFLHLDCALSLVREGLLVACEEAFLDGIPEQLKDWDKVLVSKKDALALATNGLPVNEEVYITDAAFHDAVGSELEKRGMTVEYVDFKISRSLGGAFRCSTQPLCRM